MKAKFVNSLFESSLSDILKNDILNKKLIKQFLLDDFNTELFLTSYKNESYDDFEYISDEEILESKDFNDWLLYELSFLFENLKNTFNKLIDKNGFITIYRKMAVKDDWFDKLKNNDIKRLGIYWSYDKNAAEAHWGYEGNNEIEIISKIHESYVDWVETFKLNLNQSLQEEKEIRLFKNTYIQIIDLYINGNKINPLFYKNKHYKS